MAITKVTNSLVATNAIQGTLIADNAITSVHIAQNQVTSVQIPDGSIDSTQLANASVVAGKIAAGAIDQSSDFADGVVITAKIADANITTAKIANNAITSALIPDGSITDTQLGSGAFTMGTITTTGAIRGPASFTIDPAAVGDNTGTVVIAGNLQVDGTSTTINSTQLAVADLNITVASGAASASAANNAGLTIAGAGASILYLSSGDEFRFNKPLYATHSYKTGTGATFVGQLTNSSGKLRLQSDSNRDIEIGDTNNADIIYVDTSTQRVGIGTATPSKPLHVQFSGDHGIRIESEDSHASLYVDSHTGYGQYIRFTEQNSDKYWINSTGGNLVFRPAATGTAANKITFNASGNVGIGTASPNGKLQFANDTNTRKIVLYQGANNDYQFYGFGIESQTLVYSTFESTDDHVFFSGASSSSRNELMRIKGNGNVGIGTNAPDTLLHVNGQAKFENNIILNENTPAIVIPNGDLRLFTGGSEKMRLDSNGKVGIGLASPDAKLDVNGRLRAREGLNLGQDTFEGTSSTFSFANGVANQNVDVVLPNASLWGYLEVEITGFYSNQNSPGKLTKRYALALNVGGTSFSTETRISDAIGPIVDNVHLGPIRWDAGTSTYRIRIAHIVSTGNPFTLKLKAFTTGGRALNLDGVTISSVYTQSTSGLTFHEPHYKTLGIGTESPSSFSGDGNNLVITSSNNGGDNGLSIISGTSNSGSIYFGDTQETGSASRRGQLVYNHSNDSMRVFTSAAERVRITAEGYMQMGTAKGNSSYSAMFNIVDNAGTNSLIKLRNGTGNKAIQFYGDNNVEYGFIGLDTHSGAANLLLGSADNRAIRMQSGGMQIELTDGASGTGSVDTGSLSISNTDLDADTTYNIRQGRYLTSNGSGWGSGIDGKNPALVIHNDTTTSNDRSQPGIMLHNESSQNDVYGPFIGWGSKSASGSYNTGYAWIMGCPTSTGPDSNWKAGQLELYTQGSAYVATKPGIRITSAGLVQKPRQYDANGFFWLRGTSNPSGVSGLQPVVFTTRQQAGSGNTSITTGRYTTPVEGIYHFSTNVRIDGASSASTYFRIGFYTGTSANTGQTSYGQGHSIYGPGSYSTNYFSMQSSWSVYLQENVEVGVAVEMNSGTYTIHQESQFSGHLVG
jgi:hypothetical protein